MKRTIKRLLAAVSAVSVLTFSGLSVSAATAEDVIGAARAAGFLEVYIQQLDNFLKTHSYTSAQYDMMLNAFYFENGDEVTLLGCIPFEYLIANRITSVKNLYTLTGRVNLIVRAIDDKHCQLELYSEQPLPKKIRIPEYLNPKVQDKHIKAMSNGIFYWEENKTKVTFLLTKSKCDE